MKNKIKSAFYLLLPIILGSFILTTVIYEIIKRIPYIRKIVGIK